MAIMSLDVALHGSEIEVSCTCSEFGDVHKISERPEYYSANITHNLSVMAGAAGLYMPLWRPAEMLDPSKSELISAAWADKRSDEARELEATLPVVLASDLIAPLEAGLATLTSDPSRFDTYSPANGCGTYADLLRFVRDYLEACKQHPTAKVEASR